MLSDTRIISSSAGVLGLEPSQLTLVSKRVDGTNTYANLKAAGGKEFTCVINGGNLLSIGMTNAPMCSRKGAPVNDHPLQR